jgi:hypothetical protein
MLYLRISSRFLAVHFQYCECFVSGPEEEVFALQFKWILFRLVFGLSLSFTTGNMFLFHTLVGHVYWRFSPFVHSWFRKVPHCMIQQITWLDINWIYYTCPELLPFDQLPARFLFSYFGFPSVSWWVFPFFFSNRYLVFLVGSCYFSAMQDDCDFWTLNVCLSSG